MIAYDFVQFYFKSVVLKSTKEINKRKCKKLLNSLLSVGANDIEARKGIIEKLKANNCKSDF